VLSTKAVRLLGAATLILSCLSTAVPVLSGDAVALANPGGPNLSTSSISSSPLGTVNPDSTITYTATVTNSGNADATNTTLTSTADSNTAMVPGSEAESPVAVSDTYPQTVVGNVSIDSSLIPYSVTSNDLVPSGTTITAFDATSANGGSVSMTTSGPGMGEFTYAPPVGFDGTDTFTYTLSDALGSSTGTVTLTVSGVIWFVNNSDQAGNGTLAAPFSSDAAFQAINDGVGRHPASNQSVFLYGSATSYTGPIGLLNGQNLIGAGASQSLASLAGVSPGSGSATLPATGGTAPTISGSGTTVVSLGQNNTLDGVHVNANSATGISGSSYGTFTAADTTISDTGGTALGLSNGTVQATFGSISASSAANGISVTNSTGSITSNGGTIGSSTSSAGITVDGGTFTGQSTSATLAVTLSGMSFLNGNLNPAASGCTSFNSSIDSNTNLLCNASIYLQNVSRATFSSLVVNGARQDCINGNNVSNFSLSSSTIESCGTTPAGPDLESGIQFVNLLGSSTITGSTIGQSSNKNAQWNLRVQNNTTSGSLDSLKVSGGTTFGPNLADQSIDYGGQATANMEIDVEGGSITDSSGAGFMSIGQDSSSVKQIVNGVSITDSGAEAIDITTGGSGGDGFNINNNTISSTNNADGIEHHTGILVDLAGESPDTATMQGAITNNTIGTQGVPYSGGGDDADGIWIDANALSHNSVSHMTVNVTGNSIHEVGLDGIDVTGGYGDKMAATIKGNTIETEHSGDEGENSLDGIFIESAKSSSDTSTFCGDIGGTVAADKNNVNGDVNDIETDDRTWHETFDLVNLSSYGSVAAYLSSQNSLANSAAAADNLGGYVSVVSCATPTLPSSLAPVRVDGGLRHPTIAAFETTRRAPSSRVSHRLNVRPNTIIGDTLTANLGTLNPGQSVLVQWQVTVNSDINNPSGASEISGSASVVADSLSATPLLATNPLQLFTPRLAWTQPADITYGTPLDGTELDATSDRAGTFAYNPDVSTVLDAGQNQALTATFTPTDPYRYVSGDQVSTTINVDPATLTITAHNKSTTYGGPMPAEPNYSASGFVNGDKLKFMPSLPTCSVTATSYAGNDISPPGIYAVNCSGADNPNYTIDYVPGIFTVFKAHLTITSDSKEATFGGTMPALTYTPSGFVNGEDSSALTSQPNCVSAVKSSADGLITSSPGSYPITCKGASDPNYSISNVAGTFTVDPATLTVTPSNKSATYGGPMPSTFNYAITGFVNGNTSSKLTSKPVCAPNSTSSAGLDTSGVGSYAITCSGGSSPNYTFDYIPATFSVFKAGLLITADDQSVNVGGAMPAFTFTPSGFVNGDNVNSLNPMPTCSTTAKASGGHDTSPPASYPITCRGAGEPNYSISYRSGSLQVNP
jgi:uncharacterized repeat protein (TIGR01451 family)